MRLLLALSLLLAGLVSIGHDSPVLVAPLAAPIAHPTPSVASRSRHLPPSNRPSPPTKRPKAPRILNWHALAMCESTNNPRAVSPNGLYFGLYQFDLRTWRGVGGHGNPARASRAEQTYRAELLFADRGTVPWPVCGRRLLWPVAVR